MFSFKVNKESPLYRTALSWLLPGLLVQLLGEVAYLVIDPARHLAAVPWVLYALGTVLLVVGLSFMARSKARSPLWGLLGVLSFPGWLLLALLEDRTEPEALAHGGQAVT